MGYFLIPMFPKVVPAVSIYKINMIRLLKKSHSQKRNIIIMPLSAYGTDIMRKITLHNILKFNRISTGTTSGTTFYNLLKSLQLVVPGKSRSRRSRKSFPLQTIEIIANSRSRRKVVPEIQVLDIIEKSRSRKSSLSTREREREGACRAPLSLFWLKLVIIKNLKTKSERNSSMEKKIGMSKNQKTGRPAA